MLKRLFVIILLVSLYVPARAEKITLPELPPNYVMTIEAFDKNTGQKLWQEKQAFNIGEDNKKYLLINVEGNGYYGGANYPTKWSVSAYYYIDPYIRPYFVERKVFSMSGELNLLETMFFDAKSKQIYFTSDDKLKNSVMKKNFELKDDVIDRYALPLMVLGYPFAEKRNVRFHYISNDPRLYLFNIYFVAKENVATAQGPIECFKLKMDVDLGALGAIGIMLPNNFYWVSDGKDHKFVKYEGLESGMGTPIVVIRPSKI